MSEAAVQAVRECAAFPVFVRRMALVLMLALAIGAVFTGVELRQVTWSTQSLVMFAVAYLCIAWMGYWILHSRTRLVADELVQTWLWTKRARAADVANLRLVHWPWVDAIIAPRLLVRQRNGAITWIHAADARLLHDFMAQVAERRVLEAVAPRL
ncbi:MAG: hypothetical protein ABW190_05845 [Rhizobacter sp.]